MHSFYKLVQLKTGLRFIFIIFVGLLFQFQAHAQTFLAGTVRDEIDSLPVPNVMLIADKDTVITDSLGNFKMVNKEAKKLTVISASFSPQEVELIGENEYDLNIFLSNESGLYV